MDNLKSKNIETYTTDMVKAIGSNQGGIVKKLIQEDEDRRLGKKSVINKSKKNMFFLVMGLVLFFSGCMVLFYFIFLDKGQNTAPVVPLKVGLIYTDQDVFQPVDGLTKENIAKSFFNQIKSTNVKTGGVEGVYLTESNVPISLQRFISLLKSELDQIHTSIFNERFMMGAMSKGSGSNGGNFFILLGTRSFDDVFPVMKIWERKMFRDLSLLFGVSLSPETNYLFNKDWEDGVIQNKNARILKDEAGNTVLSYVFITNRNVLITNSEMATKEIMFRLATGQVKK